MFLVTSDITQTIRSHEERLRDHDVTLRKKAVDITSLQHQLFGLLRKGSARDDAIRSIQQTISNSSFATVSLFGDDSFLLW